MKTRLLLILLIVGCIFPTGLSATIHYVADSTNPNPQASWGGTPSDANTGKWWTTAFATTNRAIAAQANGDTIFWATGIYTGIIACSSNVVYACSSFAEVNAAGEYHFAKIHGGPRLTGWTQVSGNIYSIPYTGNRPLFQSDSAIFHVLNYGSLAEGKCYYDGSGTLYAWIYGGGDPDTAFMCAARQGPIVFAGDYANVPQWYNDGFAFCAKSFTFYGLEFKYAEGLIFYMTNPQNYGNNHTDSSLFYKCKFSCVQGESGSNPALWGSGWLGSETIGTGNTIRACSLGNVWATDAGYTGEAGSWKGWFIDTYCNKYLTIDSCLFYGYASSGAIYYKHAYASSIEFRTGNVVSYNTFNLTGGDGLLIQAAADVPHLEIYGNTFDGSRWGSGSADVGFHWMCDNLAPDAGRSDSIGIITISNNTYYEVDPLRFDNANGESSGWYVPEGCIFKYNVSYQAGNLYSNFDNVPFGGDTMWAQIDSNMYFSGGSSVWRDKSGATSSFTTWQGRGHDTHSSSDVNPGFANAVIGDFSRLSASGEMDATYGGRTWSVFGAVQEAAANDHSPGVAASATQAAPSQVNRYGTNSTTVSTAFSDADQPAVSSFLITLKVRQNSNQVESVLVNSARHGTNGLTVINNGGGNYTASVSWNPSDLQPTGLYDLYFSVNDGANTAVDGFSNNAAELTVEELLPPPDTEAPTISGIGTGVIGASSAEIVWTTNEPATSQVEYGLTTSYSDTSPLDASLTTNHSVVLTGLSLSTVYHYRVRSADSAGNERVSADQTFTTLDASQVNLALGMSPIVSGSYSGYSPSVITDGVIAPRGGTPTTWASDESSSAAHWVEIPFGDTLAVSRVVIHWTWNAGLNSFMTSQEYSVQRWSGSAWIDVATVNNSSADSSTSTQFTQTGTERIRIYQPANRGPANYTTIMWLTEIEIFGVSQGGDTTAPSPVDDLGILFDEYDLEPAMSSRPFYGAINRMPFQDFSAVVSRRFD